MSICDWMRYFPVESSQSEVAKRIRVPEVDLDDDFTPSGIMTLPDYHLRLDYRKICIGPSSNGKRPQVASSEFHWTTFTLFLDNPNVLATNFRYVNNS